jgi:S1-C subfamily serine protease/uncharacterized tellurite resistance protein B-like protein
MKPPRRPPAAHGRDEVGLSTRLAIQHVLRSVARSDKVVSAEERSILDRYLDALGVVVEAPPAPSDGYDEPVAGAPLTKLGREPAIDSERVAELLNAIPVDDRVHVLRMMLRVAYADGSCSAVELALLKRLANWMGLSAVQFAEMHISIERQVLESRRTRRWLWIGAGIVAVLVVVLVVVLAQRLLSPPAPMAAFVTDAKQQLMELDRRVSEVAGTESPGPENRQIEELSTTLDALLARAAELEEAHRVPARGGPATEAVPGSGVAPDERVMTELEEIKRQLADLKNRLAFPQLLKKYADAVVLIRVGFELVSGTDRKRATGDGTGFFVSEDGLIVTNKHVVQPWKFEAEQVRLLERGYRVDESSVHIGVWPNGSRAEDDSGKPVFGGAFHSRRGELTIVALPDDELELLSQPLADGRPYEGRFHVQGNSDLALLQARVKQAVVPIPLAGDLSAVEKLDPVMVLGFPTGTFMLETGIAETVATRGEVLKIDDSLFINAPIHRGNSGGPVLDRTGRAIGVASRRLFGESSLGSCIQSPHVLPLLAAVPERDATAATRGP